MMGSLLKTLRGRRAPPPWHRRCRIVALAASVLALLAGNSVPTRPARTASTRPNIVYMLADDPGYGDVSSLDERSKIVTPDIDRIARPGMSFTDAHSSSSVCSPTRYGILTGRYSWRTRLKRGVVRDYSTHLIEPGRRTVKSLLKHPEIAESLTRLLQKSKSAGRSTRPRWLELVRRREQSPDAHADTPHDVVSRDAAGRCPLISSSSGSHESARHFPVTRVDDGV